MRALVKTLLPAPARRRLLYILESLKRRAAIAASSNRLFANLYYLVFNRGFDREHLSVLKGRVAYWESLHRIGESSALLRRNVHRLEKGLIMRPRKAVFGEAFIQETVHCYSKAVGSEQLCEEEQKWARDVLDEYFEVVADTPEIAEARIGYKKAREADGGDSEGDKSESRYSPYAYNRLDMPTVDFAQLHQLFLRRRSVRWYQDKSVPFDLVLKAANSAAYAPSACNRQPYRFKIATDKKKAVQVAKCAMGTAGFAENLPAIAVVVGDLSAYPFERDRHLIYIDGALGAMQFMLALETLGLSSCPLNWPDIEPLEERIAKLLNLEPYERVVMLIGMGYADQEGGIPFSQKKQNQLIAERIE